MKYLFLLSLLAIPTLSGDVVGTGTGTVTSTTTRKCSDDTISGALGTGDNCYCTCDTDGGDPVCKTVTDINTAFKAVDSSTATDDSRLIVSQFREACSATNAKVDTDHCSAAQIRYDSTSATCTCPTCDQSSTCDSYNSGEAKYVCYHDDSSTNDVYECRKKVCTVTEDAATGNKIAGYDVDSTAVTNDASLCEKVCEAPCTSGTVSSDDLCYHACDRVTGTIDDAATGITSVYGDKEAMTTLDTVCKERNTELKDCNLASIVPNTDADCGCGKCVERCELEGTRRYLYKTDDGTVKCREIKCSTRTVSITPTASLVGATTAETYENIRTTYEEIDVEVALCESTTDDTEETTSAPVDEDTFCQDPCNDGDLAFCVYDSTGSVQKTFECDAAFKCTMRDTTITSDRYTFTSYGPCKEPPASDGCTLDTMRVLDEYVATSKCPPFCKCIPNPLGTSYGNIEVCDTMESIFENIKKKCADRLGTDCVYERMYFTECPHPDDADICSKLFCDKEKVPDVCRPSSETFKDAISARVESTGCYYRECDTDTTSNTYGQLIDVRYDGDAVDSKGIVRGCPKLAECTQLKYNTNGLCGVCPTCPVDPDVKECDQNTLKRGDRACLDDPDDDDTRIRKDDGSGDRVDFAAKVRVKLAAKFCADELFSYPRTEIYGFIKEGAYAVSRTCDNIEVADLAALRAYISYFDYEVIAKDSTDSCDTMIKVVFRVDLCDTDLERLRKLLTCFQTLKDDDSVDIRARITTAIKDTTKNTRFDTSATSTTSTDTTNSDGASITPYTADDALVSIAKMDDSELDTVTTGSTTASPEGTGRDNGNNAVGYTIIVAVWASFIALLY